MSCNGCRVLRKGCSDSCILRPCLQWIESPESQGHATVFVAKFFGRAGLMSFISAVPQNQRPALFQSLLFEACGRTVNPVNGAVGLLWTGNWHVCQAAVDTVLRGGTLRPVSEFVAGILVPDSDDVPDVRAKAFKRMGGFVDVPKFQPGDLDLHPTPGFPSAGGGLMTHRLVKPRPTTPSMNSEESVTTTFDCTSADQTRGGERKLLNLFI